MSALSFKSEPAGPDRIGHMNTRLQRTRRILAAVRSELDASHHAEGKGDATAAFRHLERAHVLGQANTIAHVRVHWRMLRWALRHHRAREVAGQVMRIVGAATKTPVGWLPHGNTGGANVSPFRPMPIPLDLQQQIDAASR
jgi:hypothetical protein